MLISKFGYRRNYMGEWVSTPVEELNNSRHFVLVRCDECKRLYKTQWSNRKRRIESGKVDLCNPCSKSGKRNSMYGKNRKELLARVRTFQKRNGMKGNHHSAETRARMSKMKADAIADGRFNIMANNRGKKSWYVSTRPGEAFFADSALEVLRMRQLDGDASVVSWSKRHHIKVPYTHNGISRYCVPDFLIVLSDGTRVVEEVKGRVTEREKNKRDAIGSWCKDNGFVFRFLTQSDLNQNGEYRAFLRRKKK